MACGLAALAPSASADIYWTDSNAGSIGRADLDGTHVRRSFITKPVGPSGIAVDARHIFWTDVNRGTIGRAGLSGKGQIPDFVSIPEWWTPFPMDLSLDSYHLYWTQGSTFIGRARIDGRKAQPRFLDTRAGGVSGIATGRGHVFWTANDGFDPPRRVGRASLSGNKVTREFIKTGNTGPGNLARRDNYVYWVNSGTQAVSRARLAGTKVTRRFIDTGKGVPSAVAVAGGFIYWTDYIRRTIGRARLDGTNVRPNFIRVGGSRGGLRGIAVVPEHSPPPGGRGRQAGNGIEPDPAGIIPLRGFRQPQK